MNEHIIILSKSCDSEMREVLRKVERLLYSRYVFITIENYWKMQALDVFGKSENQTR